eukprot:413202-Amphidinium_carterae.1
MGPVTPPPPPPLATPALQKSRPNTSRRQAVEEKQRTHALAMSTRLNALQELSDSGFWYGSTRVGLLQSELRASRGKLASSDCAA